MSPVPEPGDATLLENYQRSRDPRAFAELNRRYVDFVYAAALRQSGNVAMAADITQAVFLVFAQKAKSIRAPALPSWLHRVTTYAVKNAQRAERRRRHHERAAATERPEVTMPFNTVDHSETMKPLLDRAIASLPAKDQTVVIERYLRARDLAEIATTVSASPIATQKRLERAIEKMRAYFSRHGVAIGAAIPWPSLLPAPADATRLVLRFPHATSTVAETISGRVMSRLILAKSATVAAACLVAATLVTATLVTAAIVTAGVEINSPPHAAPTSTTSPTTEEFSAHFNHGATVSIEGIFSVDAPDRCWRADGTPISNPTWQTSGRLDDNPRTDHGVPLKKFGVVLRVQTTGSTPAKLATFYFNDNFGADGSFNAKPMGSLNGEWSGLTTSFPNDDATATMRFVVADGDFQSSPIPPNIWGSADGKNINGHTPAGDYLISKAYLRNGVAAVNLSSSLADVVDRLEATVSQDGRKRTVIGTIVDGQSVNSIRQQIETFPGVSNLSDIEIIQLKYRQLEWAEFRNVSLRSGSQSQIQITVGTGGGPPTTDQPLIGEVYIGGDTPRPGVYSLSKKMRTLFELLDLAEATANQTDRVRVTRNTVGKETTIVDNVLLTKILSDKTNDIPLKPDDVIMVIASPR